MQNLNDRVVKGLKLATVVAGIGINIIACSLNHKPSTQPSGMPASVLAEYDNYKGRYPGGARVIFCGEYSIGSSKPVGGIWQVIGYTGGDVVMSDHDLNGLKLSPMPNVNESNQQENIDRLNKYHSADCKIVLESIGR